MAKNQRKGMSLVDFQRAAHRMDVKYIFPNDLHGGLAPDGMTRPKKKDGDVAGVLLGGNPLTKQRGDELFGKSEEFPGDLLSAFESEAAQ